MPTLAADNRHWLTPGPTGHRNMEAANAALQASAGNLKGLSTYCVGLLATSDANTALSTAKQYAIDALVGPNALILFSPYYSLHEILTSKWNTEVHS